MTANRRRARAHLVEEATLYGKGAKCAKAALHAAAKFGPADSTADRKRLEAEEQFGRSHGALLKHCYRQIARHPLAEPKLRHVHAADDARSADARSDASEARVYHIHQVAHLGAWQRHDRHCECATRHEAVRRAARAGL